MRATERQRGAASTGLRGRGTQCTSHSDRRTLSTRRAGIVLIPMPTYVYKFVKTGETIEVQQSFNEDALTSVMHPRSGRKMAVKKVFTPVGVTFRGNGFYKTDSRSTSSKKADAKAESKAESKVDATASSSSESSKSTGGQRSRRRRRARRRSPTPRPPPPPDTNRRVAPVGSRYPTPPDHDRRRIGRFDVHRCSSAPAPGPLAMALLGDRCRPGGRVRDFS